MQPKAIGHPGFLHVVDDTFLVEKSWSVSNTLKLPKETFKTCAFELKGLWWTLFQIRNCYQWILESSEGIIWRLFGKISEIDLLRCRCRASSEYIFCPSSKRATAAEPSDMSLTCNSEHVMFPSHWCHVTYNPLSLHVMSFQQISEHFSIPPSLTLKLGKGGNW